MKQFLVPHSSCEEFCPAGADPLAAKLMNKLIYFHKLQAKVMYKLVASREIFHAQMLYLTIISRREGLTHSELADCMGVERASVSSAVQRMERAGLVERRPDPKDQRVSRIYLTDRGHEMNRKTDRAMADYINRCFMVEERRAEDMMETLDLLTGNMKDYIYGNKER